MSAIEGVVAYQGWSLRGVPLYYITRETKTYNAHRDYSYRIAVFFVGTKIRFFRSQHP